MSIVGPPTEGVKSPPNTKTSELTVLAEFISERASDSFDRHLATILTETGQTHDAWSQQCAVNHWHTDFPCEDYERGLTLGIAWLKARMERGEAK